MKPPQKILEDYSIFRWPKFQVQIHFNILVHLSACLPGTMPGKQVTLGFSHEASIFAGRSITIDKFV